MQKTLSDGGRGYIDPQVKRPAVPHALRSTFRDWAAEQGHDRDMAEIQLAHTVGGTVYESILSSTDMVEQKAQNDGGMGAFFDEAKTHDHISKSCQRNKSPLRGG